MNISQVISHINSDGSENILSRFYYNGDITKSINGDYGSGRLSVYQRGLGCIDTTYRGSNKKYDRLCCWYDSTNNKLCYQEMIKGDNDTNITNDKVVYKAYIKYFFNSSTTTGYDSTKVYYWEENSIIGAHDPTNHNFNPKDSLAAWTDNEKYFIKTLIFNKDGTKYKDMTYSPITGITVTTKDTIYDKDYNPGLVIGPNDDSTKYYYSTYKNPGDTTTRYWPSPSKVKYPNGDSVMTYFSAKGDSNYRLPDSSRDEMGRITVYHYDSEYNDTAVVYKNRVLADGEGSNHDVTTRYHYNSKGNLIETLDPLGHKTIMHYTDSDTGQYMIEQRIDMGTSGEGNEDIVTQYGYNLSNGTMDTMTFYRDYPNNPSRTYYTYDQFKHLVKTVYPDTARDSMVYDLKGNLLKKYTIKTDTLYKAEYEYDPHDHLTKLKEYRSPNDSANAYDSTLYAYNLHDKMISQTNALGKITNYTYCMDRLVKIAYPDTTYDSMGYWPGGDLKFKKDRKGQVTYYQYDGYSAGCGCMSSSRSRLAKKYYYDSLDQYVNGFNYPSDSVIYDYDQVGNRTKMVDKNGTTMYSYDGLYRLQTDSCGYLNTKNRYQYDMAGNRTRLKVYKGDDTTICYLDQNDTLYDNANRLGRTTVSGDNYDFTYWDTGIPKRISYPTYGFYLYEDYWATPRGYIDSMKTTYRDEQGTFVWFRNKYTYNGLGDRLTNYVYMTRPGTSVLSGTINYTYDGLRRLKKVQNPAGFNNAATIDYAYDGLGNRLSKYRSNGNDTSYAYNQANNQLTIYDNIPPSAEGFYNYYDANGNMTTRSEWAEWYFSYDYENRLTKCKTESSDSTLLYYNGDGARLKKVGTNDSSKQYIPDGMYSVVERTNSDRLRYKYVYANGMLLARTDSSGNTYQYQHNALGSVIGVNDKSSAVYKSYLYDEFGDSLGAWGSLSNSYRYTGQEWDALPLKGYNLRAREYYPKVGRFMQNDPIGNAGGSLNWYLYVANNPVNYIDILGLSECTREEMVNDAAGIMGKSIRFYRNNVNSGMDCAHWAKAFQNMFGTPNTKCCKMTDVGYWWFNNRNWPMHNLIRVDCTSKCDDDKYIFFIDGWLAALIGNKTPIFFDMPGSQPTGYPWGGN